MKKTTVSGGTESRLTKVASGLAAGIARKFEQELGEMVAKVGLEEMAPARFQDFLGGLKALLAAVGRDAVVQTIEALDAPRPAVERDGQLLRYRGLSDREWLTAMGKVTLRRRVYRADGVGAASVVPLDEACGMVDRFMTVDIEEMAALGMAMLTAPEVEQVLAKALPEGPSATAIQRVAHRIGGEIEAQREAIEDAVQRDQALSTKGDVLAVSWDGVMAAMREESGVAWREAGVATLSIYRGGPGGPEKLDSRFLARMPEAGMKTLLADLADQVTRAKSDRSFRVIAVICDGKEAIWTAAGTQPVLADAVWILDFFHASENLMKAAVAIFGDNSAAQSWFQKHRDKLQLDPCGVEHTIRSMLRYRKQLPAHSKRRNVVDNAIQYFRYHRDRMRYTDFIAQGLPIGSGPVESAAKNIVQARLKRSGMRWSHDGGQHVLDLRAFLKSGRWESMWSTVARAA